MIRNHYDYIDARYYAIKQGKELKDLTGEEMEMFRVQAKSVPIRESKEELKHRNHNLGISVSNLLEENDYLKESIKHLMNQNDSLLEENRQLKDFIEGWEYDLTPEFRAHFPNGIR